ncbi:MAG TPA: hypothetical protein VIH96_21435, partial [Paraburkholderia sp.]
ANAGRYFPHMQQFFHTAKESMRAYYRLVNGDEFTGHNDSQCAAGKAQSSHESDRLDRYPLLA